MNEEPLVKVLIIDDDEDIVMVIRDFFEGFEQSHNLSVCTSSVALDAQKKIKDLKPDILITDILIPGADGYQLAEFAKQSNENCCVAIISGKINNETNPIVNYYLKKPFEFEKFESLVSEMITYALTCQNKILSQNIGNN
ncbi:MAG: response regulator [Candidatus Wallbacteria bacterium]